MTDHPKDSKGQVEIEPWLAVARSWLAERLEPLGHHPAQSDSATTGASLFKDLDESSERQLIHAARIWQREKQDAGYGSIDWPERYGGSGLTRKHAEAFRRLESMYVTPSGHEAMSITLEIVGPTIRMLGTERQRDRYLPALRRSDEMWCQLFSEPEAGSDLAAIRCRARHQDDSWVLDGQKVWTSGAGFADYGYIVARTDQRAKGRDGLTAFIVDMAAEGVDVRPLRQMTGGSSFYEVFLEGVRVPNQNQLGEPGAGWHAIRTTLAFERAATTRTGPSGAELFRRLVSTARRKGKIDDAVTRQRLARLYSMGRVRAFNRRRTAALAATTGAPGPTGSLGKLAWSEELREVAAVASLVGGAEVTLTGFEVTDGGWDELVLGVPGMRIAGGTDEIQRNIIAERILGLPREPDLKI